MAEVKVRQRSDHQNRRRWDAEMGTANRKAQREQRMEQRMEQQKEPIAVDVYGRVVLPVVAVSGDVRMEPRLSSKQATM